MPEPESRLLHEWLRQTAAAFPDAPAIIEEDRVTSFAQLLAQSETLAATFMELGVRKGDRIALVLSKTTEAIISVFASLLSGAPYVPIHPRWPAERIEATIEDCTARLVITAADGPPRIADRTGGRMIEWTEALIPKPTCSGPEVHSTDAALILFTSGSTGRPKGVVLSHHAVSAFVAWSAAQFQIGPDDRIACPSPLGFDLSTFDIFNMAVRGAACVLVPDDIAWMPRFLVRFLRDSHITCWYSVPSILAGMLQDGGFADHDYPALRLVLFAGEVFASPNVARLQSAIPRAICVNLYGPTETNVVTWYTVPRDFQPSQPVPIGGPCPYADLLLDDASGELLAGGESLMNGYWNRPEETERAFAIIDGKPYYRTGDRVIRDSAGQYVFVGRLDRQVKRRGFRIELGEIEAALSRHDAILEVAAVCWEVPDSGMLITACVRVPSAGALSLIDAKAHCAKLLPAYMLPDRVIFLDSIPKGNRGKTDYAALQRIAEDYGD